MDLQRRNPLRLLVTKETQLRILWQVAGGVFFSLVATGLFCLWVESGVWQIVLGLVFGALASVWTSRRIAGPFYRIEQDLDAILHGAKAGQKIQLRSGDALEHLAGLVNELIERVETK